MSFSQCQTTEDGKFLIPNGVRAIKLESHELQLNEEHHENFSSVLRDRQTKFDTRADVALFGFTPIYGSLSLDYINIKKKMAMHNFGLEKIDMYYESYKLILINGQMKMVETFRHDIEAIADALTSGRLREAEYLAQLVVGHYGTSIVTKPVFGASLELRNYIDLKDKTSKTKNELSIKTEAGGLIQIWNVINNIGTRVGGSHHNTNQTRTRNSTYASRIEVKSKGKFSTLKQLNEENIGEIVSLF